jgi:hypothetical protein
MFEPNLAARPARDKPVIDGQFAPTVAAIRRKLGMHEFITRQRHAAATSRELREVAP